MPSPCENSRRMRAERVQPAGLAREAGAPRVVGSGSHQGAMAIYWLKYRGTYFPIRQGDALLGRSPECLIILPSERVSREHAVVRQMHDGLQIEDLGSRNGTWVNGARIERATRLQPGDQVTLGDDVLEVVCRANAQAPVTIAGESHKPKRGG